MKKCKIVLTAMLSGMLLLAVPVMPVEAAEARYEACLNCGGRIVYEEEVVYESIDAVDHKCPIVQGCTYRRVYMKTYTVKVCKDRCGELHRYLKNQDICQLHTTAHH